MVTEKEILTEQQLSTAKDINEKQGLIPTLRYITSVAPELNQKLAKEYYELYIDTREQQ